MIPRFLRPEVFSFTSIEIVPAPVVAPPQLKDVTPALAPVACVCGVPVGRHYDGWDGTRLDCEEAQRRHGLIPVPDLEEDSDPFGPPPTSPVASTFGDTLAGYTSVRGRWVRRGDGKPICLDFPPARRRR